jgi:phosphoribosylaminoimidazole-succinocarboxamide synthase
LPGLPLLHQGKVRDVFGLPGQRLLMVATDRLSPSTWSCPTRFPARARCSARFRISGSSETAHLVPNHLTHEDVAAALPPGTDVALYARRSVVVKRTQAGSGRGIARGYLIGSGLEGLPAHR